MTPSESFGAFMQSQALILKLENSQTVFESEAAQLTLEKTKTNASMYPALLEDAASVQMKTLN